MKKKTLFWLVAVFIAMYMMGCGHTARELGVGALRTAAAAMQDTGRICTNAAAAFGNIQTQPGGMDSMELDGMAVPSFEEAQTLAASQGWTLSN